MSRNPKEIVSKGYDAVSRVYRGNEDDADCERYHAWLNELIPLLPKGTPILDLGCGNGIPVARRLARESFKVTGVDISPVPIERAQLTSYLAGA